MKKPQSKATKKHLAPKKPEEDAITGVIRMHPRGFGFVVPDHASDSPQDVFIPKHLVNDAVDGDQVEVVINRESQSEKGPEGKVVGILKRAHSHLAGTIRTVDEAGHILAHVPMLGASKPVIVEGKGLKVGDRVIMKVLNWGDEEKETTCEVTQTIGHISDPICDIPAAIEEFDLRSSFSKKVIAEAKAFGREVGKADLKNRKDLTKLETFTIDPTTAKDYDDALSLTLDKKGIYHLAVHIADVAHYVKAGSAMDKEASERCNSTYFPNRCLPMLPEELSNELCSLKADVIRLTISVLMDFDGEGTLINHEIVRGYIHSSKRFTYEEAFEVLNGKKQSPHSAALARMVDLCKLLKKKRSERGSVDFSIPEFVILIDEKGQPYGVTTHEYDITHQLVEEFMLKANEVVAKALTDRGKPVLYRIHEEPEEETMEDFFALARSLGFKMPAKPEQKDIQKLFDEAKKTVYGQQLSVGFIRSMRLAYYSPENVGHYGLCLEHYCHFTSPIRRYTDLITERLLFNEELGDLDVEKIALKCSEQERVSFKAESSVKLLKKLRLLQHYMKRDPDKVYTGVVTRVKAFGLIVEIPDLMLEAMLHISELENDYFVYNQKRNILYGRSSGKTHTVGETLKVKPELVDLILLESKWTLTSARKKRR